jgi:hypothetical protein
LEPRSAALCATKQYIGEPKYTPKRLDCKAKTADRDAEVPGLGTKKTAGLVVDPTLPGFQHAFDRVRKYQVLAGALGLGNVWKGQTGEGELTAIIRMS